MAIWAIGDVQGCYDYLRQLLDKINYDQSLDSLWFCGDLIGRGAQSYETLSFIRSLQNTIIVLGNHDLNFLSLCHGGGERSHDDNLDDLLNREDCLEFCDWLRTHRLFHYDQTIGWAMVHGAVDWQWTLQDCVSYSAEIEKILTSDSYGIELSSCYGDTPSHWTDTLTGKERYRAIINVFTRLRYYHVSGKYDYSVVGSELNQTHHIPWFKMSNRKMAEINIIFGHWSMLQDKSYKNVVGLDYGCVYGGSLAALRIDGEHSTNTVEYMPCR